MTDTYAEYADIEWYPDWNGWLATYRPQVDGVETYIIQKMFLEEDKHKAEAWLDSKPKELLDA